MKERKMLMYVGVVLFILFGAYLAVPRVQQNIVKFKAEAIEASKLPVIVYDVTKIDENHYRVEEFHPYRGGR